jgi:hypothetical protein
VLDGHVRPSLPQVRPLRSAYVRIARVRSALVSDVSFAWHLADDSSGMGRQSNGALSRAGAVVLTQCWAASLRFIG